jgi:hypothetical protein
VLRPGSLFAHYELEALAGSGGMGVVYRARDGRLGRRVALKIIAPHLAAQPLMRERLNREANAAAAVDHPNVVALYEAGEHDGMLYIASKWVDGTTLSRLVELQGRLDTPRAAAILVQIAGALQAAHDAGLVHRDVTPANVIVDRHDRPYLTDFGLTRRATDITGLTASGQLLGTLDYVAPEQIEGRPVDHRADLYSLGCLGWFLLCGEAPFPGTGHAAKLYAHLSAEYSSIRERRDDVPPELDDALRRAMSKDPAQRQPSARALADELATVVGAPVPASPPEASAEDAAPAAATALRAPRLGRWVERAGGAVAAAALVAAPVALYEALSDHAAGAQTLGLGRAAASVTAGAGGVLVAGGPVGTVTSLASASADAPRRVTDLGGSVTRVADTGATRYVAGGRRLIVFDDRNTAAGRRLRLPGTAGSLTAGPGGAWVALAGAPTLAQVTGTTLRTIALAHPASDIQQRGRVLWVTSGAGGTVERHDARTGVRLGRPVRLGGRPAALAVTSDAVWIVDAAAKTVLRLDPRNGRPVGAPVPVVGRPVSVAADAREVWVVSAGQHAVTRLDARTGRPLDEIGVPPAPSSIALTASAAWVTSSQGRLTRIPRV